MTNKEFVDKYTKLKQPYIYHTYRLSKEEIKNLEKKITELSSFDLPLLEFFQDTYYYKKVNRASAFKNWCLIVIKIIELTNKVEE